MEDTELGESIASRIIAPNFDAWYCGKDGMFKHGIPCGKAKLPTVSPQCARARWRAIQDDPRWPPVLEQLQTRGFKIQNITDSDYLAQAMGLFTSSGCDGIQCMYSGSLYNVYDTANQAIFVRLQSHPHPCE
jgi:hypothetical protein